MVLRKANNLGVGDALSISGKKMVVTGISKNYEIECQLDVPTGWISGQKVLWEKVQIFLPDDLVELYIDV